MATDIVIMIAILFLTFIFLAAGVVVVPFAVRFGLGSVLGYLLAGIIISPLLLALGVDIVSIQHFAEFGIVMMLFLVGLELDPKLLWKMRHKLLGLGGMQVTGTALVVMIIGILLGQPWKAALAIGLILALSSTAIVLQTFNEKKWMRSDGGQAGFSVLLFQDIAVIPMLALLPLLASPEFLRADQLTGIAAEHAPNINLIAGLDNWLQTLITLGAVGFVVIAGGFLTQPVFRFVSSAGLHELLTATALSMVVGIALLMSMVGLSPALGTFLAGVVLANSEYRHQLESTLEPFKGLLLGLFFMTVGAGIDFQLLSSDPGLIVSLTIALIVVKATMLFCAGTVFGLRGTDRWLLTLGLAQAGEFGFVLLTFAVGHSVLPETLANQLLLVVAMSMLFSPLLFIVCERFIVPKFEKQQVREADEITEQGQIIIAGHGRFGGTINRMLNGAGYTTTVLDFSSSQLERLRKFGIRVYYGDPTRPELLQAAGIENSEMIVVAIDGKDAITNLVKYVHDTYPNVHIIARAIDREHVYELYAAGCRDIIRETFDSSVRAGRSAFEALGLSTARAEKLAKNFTKEDRTTLTELAPLYDPAIPSHENAAYVAKVKEFTAERNAKMKQGVSTLDEFSNEDIPEDPYTLKEVEE